MEIQRQMALIRKQMGEEKREAEELQLKYDFIIVITIRIYFARMVYKSVKLYFYNG